MADEKPISNGHKHETIPYTKLECCDDSSVDLMKTEEGTEKSAMMNGVGSRLPMHIHQVSGPKPLLERPLPMALLFILAVFIYSSYTILVHLCEVDGKIPFSSLSVNLLIELGKILVSIALYLPEVRQHGLWIPTVAFCLPFAVPAILYAINNNIAVHMQVQMDPTTYQVLSNMKIATTAVLYRIIIKRELTKKQWFSLGVLTLAGVFDSYAGLHGKKEANSMGRIHLSLQGLVMITVYCFISGFSGVYTEYILKKHYQASLYLQNIVLYSFGIGLNSGVWLLQAVALGSSGSFHLFEGFSVYTWIIIATQVANGLIMSAIMKHSSNITRLFLISCAMVVTTALSVLIFGLHLSPLFFLAAGLVICALVLYHV